MLIKSHEVPEALLNLLAIQRRLASDHPQYAGVKTDLAMYQSGYRGELALDYHLNFLDEKESFILHGVRLQNRNFFQIDTLVLTNKFFLIVEVKNLTGVIRFDHGFGQMTQERYGENRPFKDPIAQADNQAFQLQSWLIKQEIRSIPIETLVVFVSSNVHLTRVGESCVDDRIIHAGKLNEVFKTLHQKYQRPLLELHEIRKLAIRMKKQNQPLRLDMMKKYKLTASDIVPGVICESCGGLPMIRKNGIWECRGCGHQNKNSHLETFKDFQLLFKDTISNREARWLLQLDDQQVMSKILGRSGLQHNGGIKGRRYFLNYDYQKDYFYLLN
ncbi:Nuclease-related domain-containing protein [Thalassobacillus cyri]|uniref:Nuclease-related domain-containing protein n=1 Tax=Thalassobacillus cyri TaxID=571932 RepID=A0A1H4FTG8_9BACI|nr:NERD domain-containing protein [Thalassobacillus cyri]SEB00377.1 Nuclease-related domain-containing protein [Thalassobacillus cyri]